MSMDLSQTPTMPHPDPANQSDTHPGNTGAFADHDRHWDDFKYVYPVVSRRSKGLSIGINLNPDTICNFDCVYCQVDKIPPPRPLPVDTASLADELDAMLLAVATGELWDHPRFAHVAPDLRRLNDIAFSGDGEPTASKCFPQAVNTAVHLKQKHALGHAKLVLITNATLLNRPEVEDALKVMDANHGEVWAKLDTGTQDDYDRIDRSPVPLKRVIENILACGKRRPITIQSMLLKMHGEPMSDEAFDAYADRLAELIDAGCQIKTIQLYTVARKPLEAYVEPLSNDQLNARAEQLRNRLTPSAGGANVTIETFGQNG